MALINFNELTEFGLRLVNLYYHNTSLDVAFEPMSSASERVESECVNAILSRSVTLEGANSNTCSGRLRPCHECARKPIAAECSHSPGGRRGSPRAGCCGPRGSALLSSAHHAGFPQTLPIFVCIVAIVGHERPHHYFESP